MSPASEAYVLLTLSISILLRPESSSGGTEGVTLGAVVYSRSGFSRGGDSVADVTVGKDRRHINLGFDNP